MPARRRWRSWPTSPTLRARARSGSATSRTSSCRMSRSRACRKSTARSDRLGFAEANVGMITDIIACPGLDYCALANARSIPVAQRISDALRRPGAPARHRRAEDQDLAAASTPAATTTSATSASSASIRRARSSTSSASAATSTSARRALGTILGPAVAGRQGGRGRRRAGRHLSRRAPGRRALRRHLPPHRRRNPSRSGVYGNP